MEHINCTPHPNPPPQVGRGKEDFIIMRKRKSGFTLVETLIACGIMVVAFAIIAIIFGRAYDISKTIKRGSKNQRWGAYLMNTILYGPGKTSTEGLIAAYKVYHPDDYPGTLSGAPYNYPTDTFNPSQYLCFSTSEKKPIIYEICKLVDAANSLYRNVSAGSIPYDHTTCFDLKPPYAKESKVELLPRDHASNPSGFYFYDEHNNLIPTGGTEETKEIKRVGIKLVIKNAFQNINQAIVLYQNLRIRNLYSLE